MCCMISILRRDAHMDANQTLYRSYINIIMSRKVIFVPPCLLDRCHVNHTGPFSSTRNMFYFTLIVFIFSAFLEFENINTYFCCNYS